MSFIDIRGVRERDYLSLKAFELLLESKVIVADRSHLPAFLGTLIADHVYSPLPDTKVLTDQVAHIERLLETNPHVLLLGHDSPPQFSPTCLLAELGNRGIPCEIVPCVGLVSTTRALLRDAPNEGPILDLTTLENDATIAPTLLQAAIAAKISIAITGTPQQFSQIVDHLERNVIPRETLVLVISEAGTPQQQVSPLDLAQLVTLSTSENSLVFIAPRGIANNYEAGVSLRSPTVLITREEGPSGPLARELMAWGAQIAHVPTVEVAPPHDAGKSLALGASRLDTYDWVIFTSARSVDTLLEKVPDVRRFGNSKIAAVGRATAQRLRDSRLVPDLVPNNFSALALIASFPAGDGRVLLPQSELADDTVSEGLRAKGWEVQRVAAYTTKAPSTHTASVPTADIILFASPSAVKNFIDIYGLSQLPACIGSIGPSTTSALTRHGLTVDFEAQPHTLSGLSATLQQWWINSH